MLERPMNETARQGRLADAVLKLVAEAGRLDRDVVRLLDRIEPVVGQADAAYRGDPGKGQKLRTDHDAFDCISDARGRIINAEYHLNAIRGMVDAIQNDSLSRDELKPWIK